MPISAERRRQLRAQKKPSQTCLRCGNPMNKRIGAKFCSPACKEPLSPQAADERVKRYFKRCPSLPENLGKLLQAIGLTPTEARRLRQVFGPHYWGSRYAQAWRKASPDPFPSGQQHPSAASHWNNLSKAFNRGLNLKKEIEMNGYDFGLLLTAIKATLPTKKLEAFDELMYRGAMSAEASDALRFALGVDRAAAQLRKFEVIQGGAA